MSSENEFTAESDNSSFQHGTGRVIQVLGAIILIAVSGFLISQVIVNLPMYFVFAGCIAVILSLILVKNLQFGLLMFMFISVFAIGESPGISSPNSDYKAGLMPSQMILAFLALLWVGKIVFTGKFKLAKTGLNLPMGMLALTSILSLAFNNVLKGSRDLLFHQMIITQVAEVGLLFLSIMAFFLAANIFKDNKWIRLIPVPMIILSSIYVFFRLTGMQLPVAMPWLSLVISGAIAMMLSMIFFREMSKTSKVFLSLLLIAFLAVTWMDIGWISGFVAATVALTVVSWYRSKALTVGIISILLIMLFVYPGIYANIQNESAAGGDFDRFIIWADAFKMFISVDPVFGIGPGNYHPYVYYHSSIWFGGNTYTTAHSNYIGIASELGLAGLAVLLWVVISALVSGNRSVRSASPDMKWFNIGAVAYFAGIAVASILGDYMFPSRGNNGIVNFGTTVYVWLVTGAALASAGLSRGNEPAVTVPDTRNS